MDMSHNTGHHDLRVLWNLLFKRVRGNTHADRLNSFYEGQARGYDSFRSRLLHGRREMIDRVQIPDRGVWVDIGAGTGENAEYLAHRRTHLMSMYLVDLCRPKALRPGRGAAAWFLEQLTASTAEAAAPNF